MAGMKDVKWLIQREHGCLCAHSQEISMQLQETMVNSIIS
jgi:hypothetical protein